MNLIEIMCMADHSMHTKFDITFEGSPLQTQVKLDQRTMFQSHQISRGKLTIQQTHTHSHTVIKPYIIFHISKTKAQYMHKKRHSITYTLWPRFMILRLFKLPKRKAQHCPSLEVTSSEGHTSVRKEPLRVSINQV